MEYLTIPEFPVLRGEKAIKALHNFIDELAEQRGKELTERQTTALIKLSNELISTIKVEARSSTSDVRARKHFSKLHHNITRKF